MVLISTIMPSRIEKPITFTGFPSIETITPAVPFTTMGRKRVVERESHVFRPLSVACHGLRALDHHRCRLTIRAGVDSQHDVGTEHGKEGFEIASTSR